MPTGDPPEYFNYLQVNDSSYVPLTSTISIGSSLLKCFLCGVYYTRVHNCHSVNYAMPYRVPDRGKKAFEIAKLLLNKNLVNLDNVDDFIGLVEQIESIL